MSDREKLFYSVLGELRQAIDSAMATLEGVPASSAPCSFASDSAYSEREAADRETWNAMERVPQKEAPAAPSAWDRALLPILNLEHRSPVEVFDMMATRIRNLGQQPAEHPCDFEHEKLSREIDARREEIKQIEGILDLGGSFTCDRTSTRAGVQLLLNALNEKIVQCNNTQPKANQLDDALAVMESRDGEAVRDYSVATYITGLFQTIDALRAGTSHHNDAIKARDAAGSIVPGLDLSALSPAETIRILAQTLDTLTQALSDGNTKREEMGETIEQLKFALDHETTQGAKLREELHEANARAAKAADLVRDIAEYRSRDERNATLIKEVAASLPVLKVTRESNWAPGINAQTGGEPPYHVPSLITIIRNLVSALADAEKAPDENKRFKKIVSDANDARVGAGLSIPELEQSVASPAAVIDELASLLVKAREELKNTNRTLVWRDNEIRQLKDSGHIGDFSGAKLEMAGYLLTAPEGSIKHQPEAPVISLAEKKKGWKSTAVFKLADKQDAKEAAE
jgi:hypothetical protein